MAVSRRMYVRLTAELRFFVRALIACPRSAPSGPLGRGRSRLAHVLIDGNAYAKERAATLRVAVEALPQPAAIATILVGDDLGAEVYQRRIDRHARDLALLSLGMPRFIPSTPAAAFHILDRYTAAAGRDPAVAYDGLNLVLVGCSNNVGKPAAILGLQRNATVEGWGREAGRRRRHRFRRTHRRGSVADPGWRRPDHRHLGPAQHRDRGVVAAGPPPRPRDGMQGLAAPIGFDWPPGSPE